MDYYNDVDGGCGCGADGGDSFVGGDGGGGGGGAGGALYSGSAAVGRISTGIGMVVAILIALVLIIIGVMQLTAKRSQKAEATVTSVTKVGTIPDPNGGAPQNQYQLTLTFVSGSGNTQKPITLSSVRYDTTSTVSSGETLTVYYDPSNPSDAIIKSVSPKVLGGGLIAGALVIAGAGIGFYVLARKSKAFAAVEGVAAATSAISGAIR